MHKDARGLDDWGTTCVVVTPDGNKMFTGSKSGVHAWSLPSKRPLGKLAVHTGPVISLAITSDGRTLASSSNDRTIQLWDTVTTRHVATISKSAAAFVSLAVFSDGQAIATGNRDGMVNLWNLRDGTELSSLTGHGSAVSSLLIVENAAALASASLDKSVRLWRPRLVHLALTPVCQMSREDESWVSAELQKNSTNQAVQPALEFIATMLRFRRRYDIEVEDAPMRGIDGATDILIG
jgi:WD40 repeat protein